MRFYIGIKSSSDEFIIRQFIGEVRRCFCIYIFYLGSIPVYLDNYRLSVITLFYNVWQHARPSHDKGLKYESRFTKKMIKQSQPPTNLILQSKAICQTLTGQGIEIRVKIYEGYNHAVPAHNQPGHICRTSF